MHAHELPAEISATVTVGTTPLPGGLLEVELPMRQKNSFRFPLGPADSNGHLRITADDLAARARRINDLFPMDYVGLKAAWTGEVILKAVGRGGVRRLRQAHKTWSHTGVYAPDFRSQLDRLERALAAIDDHVPVAVEVDPPNPAVSTRTSLSS
jgi:hypothetical protein